MLNLNLMGVASRNLKGRLLHTTDGRGLTEHDPLSFLWVSPFPLTLPNPFILSYYLFQ